jgi:class 3 adenylate cyclase
VATREVRDEVGQGFSWSSAGRRRLKGVRGEVEVFRVRPGPG